MTGCFPDVNEPYSDLFVDVLLIAAAKYGCRRTHLQSLAHWLAQKVVCLQDGNESEQVLSAVFSSRDSSTHHSMEHVNLLAYT